MGATTVGAATVGATTVGRDVYDWCMRTRTNIEIDDDHVRVIMARYGLRTKTDAVDLALRSLAGQPMSREEALGMRGAHAFDLVDDTHDLALDLEEPAGTPAPGSAPARG